jgi:tetratricopeptide (TPR) repeat protein
MALATASLYLSGTAIAGTPGYYHRSDMEALNRCAPPRHGSETPQDIEDRLAACTRVIGSSDIASAVRAAALSDRGTIYSHRGEYDLAVQDFDKAIALMPTLTAPYVNRGNAHRMLQQFDRAIADYTKAMELNPKMSIALRGRAQAYAALGQMDRVRADLEQALALDPDGVSALRTRCLMREFGEKSDTAPADCEKPSETKSVAQADSSSSEKAESPEEKTRKALLKRGYGFLEKAQYDNARKDFEDVLREDAKDAAALYGRGLAKAKAGDTAGGNADMALAKSLDPKVADAYTEFDAKQ